MPALRVPSRATVVIPAFLPWYAIRMPTRIVCLYFEYARAVGTIFSFRFLIGTLFAPWKSITDAYPDNVFLFNQIAGVFALNAVSRFMGAIIRLMTIAIGIVIHVMLFIAFAAFFVIWVGYPVLLPVGLQVIPELAPDVAIGIVIALAVFPLIVAAIFRLFLRTRPRSSATSSDPVDALANDVFMELPPGSADLPRLLQAALATQQGEFISHGTGIKRADLIAAFKASADAAGDVESFVLAASPQRPVTAADLLRKFYALPSLKPLLNSHDLLPKDIERIIAWERFHATEHAKPTTLEPEGLLRMFGALGRSWLAGYTFELDRLTSDIGQRILWRGRKSVVIRESAIADMFRVMGRAEGHNVLILGDAGTGKTALVENMAYELLAFERSQGRPYTRILALRTEELLSSQIQPDRFLLGALRHASHAGKFILVAENVGMLLRASSEALKIVLLKLLRADNISVIGTASPDEYHALLKNDPALDTLFEKIPLEQPSEEDTLHVLMARAVAIEHQTGIHTTYRALKAVMDCAARYLPGKGMPGQAVKILDDAADRASGSACITDAHVQEAVSLQAHMDLHAVTEGEKQKLMTLESTLSKRVIGQPTAVKALVNTLKRARLDINNGKKPLGTFLFLGPTGVGKTQTAKALAEEYFGSGDSFIRLDMNEYSTEGSVAGIIGSPETGSGFNEGFLTKRVQDRPRSLVLLDEIEKAHPHVLNLFLQILDEGYIIDKRGQKTDFRNTIIIATSNAGALFIRDFLKQHGGERKDDFKQSLLESILQQKIFSPEFVNRFDEVILYYPLTEADTAGLVRGLLDDIVREMEERKGIAVTVDADVIPALVKKGYSIEFGAREMKRTITDTVENFLADAILKNDIRTGGTIRVTKEDLHI